MPATKRLIVNADDFGLSVGVNRGVIEAHTRGIVTSASLMVRWPAAPYAAEYAKCRQDLSLGLHIDLGEWVYRAGAWAPLYEVASRGDKAAVVQEVLTQLAAFRQLVGREPTHLDSHQHVHVHEPVRAVLMSLANELDVPLRHVNTVVRYCGEFYGQTTEGEPLTDAIGVDRLLAILSVLPEGATELACHPGFADDLNTTYRLERLQEVRTLCDPRVRSMIGFLRIELCSFRALNEKTPVAPAPI